MIYANDLIIRVEETSLSPARWLGHRRKSEHETSFDSTLMSCVDVLALEEDHGSTGDLRRYGKAEQ